MGQSSSKDGRVATVSSLEIPPTINCYGPQSIMSSHGTLGQHEANPLFTYSMPRNMRSEMAFWLGTDTSLPPLARSKTTGLMSRDLEITLPDFVSNSGQLGGTHILRHEQKWTKEQFWFATQIGDTVERFEWRRSHGDEVKSVGRWKWGWKLVRMNSEVKEGEKNRTSDGKEVVAVFAPATKTLTKIGEFQFVQGSSAEQLGDSWKAMSAFSLVCIVVIEMVMSSSGAAGA